VSRAERPGREPSRTPDCSRRLHPPPTSPPKGGANATNALLDLDEPPTAIVYANDLMAIAGMSTAVSRASRSPASLSVTGFDDTPLSAYSQPALTTVRTDVVGWGAAAARQLLAVIDTTKPAARSTCRHPSLSFELQTAPPRQPGIGAPRKDRRGSAPIRHRKETR